MLTMGSYAADFFWEDPRVGIHQTKKNTADWISIFPLNFSEQISRFLYRDATGMLQNA
jgi:hypothetical protein